MLQACSIYGLGVAVNKPVPGLTSLLPAPQVDVKIYLAEMPVWLDSALEVAPVWYRGSTTGANGLPRLLIRELAGGEYLHLGYADGTKFLLDRQGTQVWAIWPDTLTVEDTATYLLGPILGFLLCLRGVVCLHANAVEINGKAVAMIGPAGAGKSTTAAAFARAGYKVLTDDVLALDERADGFLARPAYPRVRLWPESVKALYGAEDALPLLTPNWDKRYLDLLENGAQFQTQPQPLAAIYLLDERSPDPRAPYVEPAPSQESLMALVANTYANYLLDAQMRAAEFKVLGCLIERVPVRRVIPHANLSFLPELCRVIVEDFQSLASPATASRGA
jgi:hypothetical protein